MESNKVILDLDTYNELRDFKNNYDKGNTVKVIGKYFSDTYITTDEAINEIANKNNELMTEYETLLSKCNDFEKNYKHIVKILALLEHTSYWKFRKWRKRNFKDK